MSGRRERALAIAGCLAVAAFAALWSTHRVGLLPPKLTPRALHMATASTSMLVDTPVPSLVDQHQDTYAFTALHDRAVLLGTVMANGPVREAIARRAGVPLDGLRVEAPLTREQPRVTVEPGREKKTGDILRSNDQYRVDIEVNPTVPVLDVYVLAPSAAEAAALANATFAVARGYADRVEAQERTPGNVRLTLTQMGRAEGAVIDPGAGLQLAAVAFVLAFAATAALLLALARIRRGWGIAVFTERIKES